MFVRVHNMILSHLPFFPFFYVTHISKVITSESDMVKYGLCVCVMIKFYSAIKKNGIMPFAGKWMKLEKIISSKISQTQKVKGEIFFPHMWKLKRKN